MKAEIRNTKKTIKGITVYNLVIFNNANEEVFKVDNCDLMGAISIAQIRNCHLIQIFD